MAPGVTIGIPTRNRADQLAIALASALAQTYEPLTIIVSDNDSTDHTETVVAHLRDKRVRYTRQPPGGVQLR